MHRVFNQIMLIHFFLINEKFCKVLEGLNLTSPNSAFASFSKITNKHQSFFYQKILFKLFGWCLVNQIFALTIYLIVCLIRSSSKIIKTLYTYRQHFLY